MKRATQVVHAPRSSGDPWGAMSTPIYQTATFAQPSAEGFGTYDYTRSGNPTRDVLEAQLAALEEGTGALTFASGLAALDGVLRLVGPGERVVAGADLYGGTCRLLEELARPRGVVITYVDASDSEALARACVRGTRLVLVETPTNPSLSIVDLRAAARAAHAVGARLVVDNTMLSPWLQQPLELGADLVVHSATKHLSGHSDLTAGAVVGRDPELLSSLGRLRNASGTALAPFEAWLLLRGLKTLGVRLDRQQQSAAEVARFLDEHPLVERVYWPGLANHPGAALHAGQASGAGCVLSFVTGSRARSVAVVEGTQLFETAVSFGSVHSTLSLPSAMSHASVPAELRERCAPPDDLVRLSIGLEDPGDLVADLGRALDATRAPEQAGTVCP